jgi:hypothetical protein
MGRSVCSQPRGAARGAVPIVPLGAQALGVERSGSWNAGRGRRMSEGMQFIFGAPVNCQDGACGDLRSAIVDSAVPEITHLIVNTRGRSARARLVPTELVKTSTAREVRLTCTHGEFDALGDAETTEVLPGQSYVELHQEQVQAILANHIYGRRPDLFMTAPDPRRNLTDTASVTRDNVPQGEGEVGRGQPVHASDGDVGHVKGLVADADGRQMTHVLVDQGHLWGKKEVAIPASAVMDVFENGVYVGLTKQQIDDLPPVAASG